MKLSPTMYGSLTLHGFILHGGDMLKACWGNIPVFMRLSASLPGFTRGTAE